MSASTKTRPAQPKPRLEMPPRQPSDGAIAVNRPAPDRIAIVVSTDGVESSIAMGDFNAWRLFGMLALFLEIPLPASTGKAIKFGDGPTNLKSGNGVVETTADVAPDGSVVSRTRVTPEAVLLNADAARICAAARDCAAHEVNGDTCGVCGKHFGECEAETRCFGHASDPEMPIPLPIEFACPGARLRAALATFDRNRKAGA